MITQKTILMTWIFLKVISWKCWTKKMMVWRVQYFWRPNLKRNVLTHIITFLYHVPKWFLNQLQLNKKELRRETLSQYVDTFVLKIKVMWNNTLTLIETIYTSIPKNNARILKGEIEWSLPIILSLYLNVYYKYFYQKANIY